MTEKPQLSIGGLFASIQTSIICPHCGKGWSIEYPVSYGDKSTNENVISRTRLTCPACQGEFFMNDKGEMVN